MSTELDVVVVGGGIAGASLAGALAGAGLGVTVLEASEEFPDRVRGESMQAWGVNEARLLGVEGTLMDAGAHVAPLWKGYNDQVGEATQIPMDLMVPGVGGTLNLYHPRACQALLDAAASAGATVKRGVSGITVTPDAAGARVAFDGEELRAGLVVGADGRNSTVRRQVGIELERQAPISHIAGLLLDDLADVPTDHDAMVSDGDLFLLLFHQGGGRARAYVCVGRAGQQRFAGPSGPERLLEAWAASCFPWGAAVGAATPAGPCATYPGDDTWTAAPYVDGVVLIGDAAGHNDPIIGQGLSIAMRDARTVRDVVLDGGRDTSAFADYGQERSTRMERLRFIADLIAVTQVEDADNRIARRQYVDERMAAMDPEVFSVVAGAFAGPETVPAELVDTDLLERIRAA